MCFVGRQTYTQLQPVMHFQHVRGRWILRSVWTWHLSRLCIRAVKSLAREPYLGCRDCMPEQRAFQGRCASWPVAGAWSKMFRQPSVKSRAQSILVVPARSPAGAVGQRLLVAYRVKSLVQTAYVERRSTLSESDRLGRALGRHDCSGSPGNIPPTAPVSCTLRSMHLTEVNPVHSAAKC